MSIKKVGTYGSISEASEFGHNVAQYIDCGKLKKENYMYPLFSTHKNILQELFWVGKYISLNLTAPRGIKRCDLGYDLAKIFVWVFTRREGKCNSCFKISNCEWMNEWMNPDESFVFSVFEICTRYI